MDFDISRAQTPSLLRRLGAIFYDGLLLVGIMMIVTGLVSIPYGLITGANYYESALALNLLRLILLAVVAAFFVYFWTHGGQTLGMRAWRLRALDDNGQPLTTATAFKRFVWAFVSLLPAGLGLLWCLFDGDKLAWHDRKSQTRLVMVAKQ
ncbi:RDD family protein [Marichromatium bheemlicum]|nr:RDD family protein [Marichromatium bheemlicum]